MVVIAKIWRAAELLDVLLGDLFRESVYSRMAGHVVEPDRYNQKILLRLVLPHRFGKW